MSRQLPSTPCAGCCCLFMQALITGAFSMVYQSMAMGCFPRFRVHHTSEEVGGQIFIPEVGEHTWNTAQPHCQSEVPAAAFTAASMLSLQESVLACCPGPLPVLPASKVVWWLFAPVGQLHLAGALCSRCGGLPVWHRHRQCLWWVTLCQGILLPLCPAQIGSLGNDVCRTACMLSCMLPVSLWSCTASKHGPPCSPGSAGDWI